MPLPQGGEIQSLTDVIGQSLIGGRSLANDQVIQSCVWKEGAVTTCFRCEESWNNLIQVYNHGRLCIVMGSVCVCVFDVNVCVCVCVWCECAFGSKSKRDIGTCPFFLHSSDVAGWHKQCVLVVLVGMRGGGGRLGSAWHWRGSGLETSSRRLNCPLSWRDAWLCKCVCVSVCVWLPVCYDNVSVVTLVGVSRLCHHGDTELPVHNLMFRKSKDTKRWYSGKQRDKNVFFSPTWFQIRNVCEASSANHSKLLVFDNIKLMLWLTQFVRAQSLQDSHQRALYNHPPPCLPPVGHQVPQRC